MESRIIVVGIVSNQDGKILLGKKAKGRPPYPDVWHTIGGGIDDLEKGKKLLEQKLYDDEYFHQELQRELKEEAKISVKNIKNICPKYRETPRESVTKNKHDVDTHYIFLEYFCETESSEMTPSDDIAELEWFDKSDLKKIQMTPPSIEMYKELGWL